MNIAIPRKALLGLLANACPIAAGKTPMPVLTHVRLAAEGATLTVSATDLVTSYTGRRPATVVEAGSVCVPAALLRDVVTKLPEGEIKLTLKAHRLAITSKGQRRVDSLVTMPGETMPIIPAPGRLVHDLPAEAFAEITRLTQYAMANDLARAHLAATCLEYRAGMLRAVTTDSHRLCLAERTVPAGGDGFTVLIPRAAYERLAFPTSGTMRFTVGSDDGTPAEKGPVFVADPEGNDVWSTKLVDAIFPSYHQVLPRADDRGSSITVDRQQLAESIAAVGVVSSSIGNRIVFSIADGALHLATENPELGEMSDAVPAELSGKFPESWAINGTYIAQTLASTAAPRVVMHVSGELDPILITIPGDEHTLALIMPTRVRGG